VAAGNEFSLALDSEGKVYSCGSQQYGQCGSGITGEYIVSAGRSTFKEIPHFSQIITLASIRVVAIAAGGNHGVALDEDGLVYTWGYGAYGRLGNGAPADVLVPTKIKLFETVRLRVASIAAGSSSTFAITKEGSMLYFAGITKKSGEANMNFKPIHDLAGYEMTVTNQM
jgi:alpha-tubulin suppressor-like RCC1 family protein